MADTLYRTYKPSWLTHASYHLRSHFWASVDKLIILASSLCAMAAPGVPEPTGRPMIIAGMPAPIKLLPAPKAQPRPMMQSSKCLPMKGPPTSKQGAPAPVHNIHFECAIAMENVPASPDQAADPHGSLLV